MDISETIKNLKQEPGFSDHVGMILVHNGVVRSWSRKDRSPVARIKVTPDYDKIEEIRKRFENKPGIFRIIIKACSGMLRPGDDLLFIVVAGDIRDNVKPVLSDILDVLKTEAVSKTEFAS